MNRLFVKDFMAVSAKVRFEKDDLGKFLLRNVDSALVFYKRLAGMLGNRLIQCYKLIYHS